MADRALHLYYCLTESFRDPSALSRCDALLDAGERERRDRFRYEKDRHLYRVAHALTRLALARHLGEPDPSVFRFEPGPHGRPELLDRPPGLFFNLSHTEGLVAVGVALGREVGVDVEGLNRRHAGGGVAERFFAKPEVRSMDGLEGDAFTRRFFDFWTLKEAYLKARGAGLSLPLDKFDFQFEGDALSVRIDPSLNDAGPRWQFGLYDVAGTHRLAYCVERQGESEVEVKLSEWRPFQAETPGEATLLARTPKANPTAH